MNITIKTIPHSEQRYATVGDWWFDEAGDLQIRVSRAPGNLPPVNDWKYEAMIAFHELAETLLCKDRGISVEMVDAFDKSFVQSEIIDEAGDHPNSPYRKEHFFATTVERLLAAELGVNWNDYADAVDEL